MARAVDTATLPEDTIREALEHIAQGLRQADRDEVRATAGDEDPFWALFESWEASTRSWLILDRTNLPIGIFGVAPHSTPGVGIAWLLGTDGVEREALSIGRQTRQYVDELNATYPVLWANVDARNELSMRWLEWSNFKVFDLDPAFGPEGRPFLQYLRTS